MPVYLYKDVTMKDSFYDMSVMLLLMLIEEWCLFK